MMRSDRRATARERGYTTRWDKARAGYLAKHPLCVMCERAGAITIATVVDHVRQHKGDSALFWDSANWQALCKPHHDTTKQRAEARGYEQGNDIGGRPLDAAHPWNRSKAQ